ncbi:MAG: hypothetical protein RSF90_00340 [Pygmaiobacter sp.]
MEEKNELLPEENELEDSAQPLSEMPEPVDPRNENFINWKERMYDKIPEKKVPSVLKFLDRLIPAIMIVIVLIFIFGQA